MKARSKNTSKKSPFELACEEYSGPCPSDYYGCNNNLDCVECRKRDFIKRADIPDGWEVVKEIRNLVFGAVIANNFAFFNPKISVKERKYLHRELKMIFSFIDKKLQQAGKEK